MRARDEYSLTNKVALNVLKSMSLKSKIYDWSYRGSDERQFCSPNINLPIGVIMRTKFGKYSEYHTSDDKIGKVVNAKGFEGSFNYVKKIIETFENNFEKIENNFIPIQNINCELFFEKRKINYKISASSLKILRNQNDYEDRYFKVSGKIKNDNEILLVSRVLISNVLWLCNGKNDLLNISNILGLPFWEINRLVKLLVNKKILINRKK